MNASRKHTVRSKEMQRNLLKRIIPCVIKCKVGTISTSLASNQGIVMVSFVFEAIKKNYLAPYNTCVYFTEHP